MSTLQEEAAGWFAQLQNAGPDHPDRSRFAAWLRADPAHAAAYAALTRLWGQFDSTADVRALAEAVERRRDALRRGRRQILKLGGVGILLAGGAGEILYRRKQNEPIWQLARQTGIAQLHTLSLKDGSTLTEGADSEVRIAFSRAERHVLLLQGEVIFDVARDADRPFVIDSGALRITVLGTRFVVTRLSDRVRVSVDHGRVQLATGPFWHRQVLVLQDGQVGEQKMAATGLSVLRALQRPAADGFAFASGRIIFDKASLEEIAETLSRYRTKPIRVLPGSAAAPPLTAVVQLSDISGFLHLLPRISPVIVGNDQGQTWLSAR